MTTERKKLTLTELLENTEQYKVKHNVTEDLYIERLGADITIKKLDEATCTDSFEMTKDGTNSDYFIVYHSVVEPNLKDAKLQEKLKCVEPTDIVKKIFELGEIALIAQAAIDLAGYDQSGVKKVKDLKK